MREEKELPYSELTRTILQCCFEVMKELGAGFLENVYKNALFIAIKQAAMKVLVEQKYEIVFRNQKIGQYIADLVIDNKASGLPVGLLVNFGNQKLEYRRLHHPNHLLFEEKVEVALPWEKDGLIT